MAVVKMGQIKSTPAKALAYISRPDATSDGLWVSTNAAVIDPGDFKAVARQFADTAKRVGVSSPRAGSVLAHHVIQSFAPGEEMTVEVAHKLGVQLAEQVTGGSHEYMIATHLDKGHVHNHIIFNSVNFETGRKFRVQKDTIGRIRDLSDELCKAEGLSVLPPLETPATGRSLAELYRVLKGESAKEFLRCEIDRAAAKATSWTEFEGILGRAGIETSVRGGRNGTLSFREISMGRPVGDFRLGAAYTEQSIMTRMSKSVVNMVGVDASMIVKESRDTLTVTVPGTKRELQLTVAKRQVVWHGRALRIYVPAAEQHRLADKAGNIARTVNTQGLYQYFSEPDLQAALTGSKQKQVDGSMFAGWGAAMSDLRELQARVNAKARWINPYMFDAVDAVEKAKEHLQEQQLAYQTTLVAAAELVSDPMSDPTELRAVQAQLRIIERDIDTVGTDIRALTQLTAEEGKAASDDRDNATGHTSPESATTAMPTAEQPQPAPATERNDVAAPTTLQERLDARLSELRARKNDGVEGPSSRGRNR
jgi:hypothetical protein